MTFTLATEKYDKLFEDPGDSSFKMLNWFNDGRRLLM